MRQSLLCQLPDDAAKARLDFKWMGAAIKGGFHLASLYLISRIGIMAEANQNILDAAAARISLITWGIGGDFNCTPE